MPGRQPRWRNSPASHRVSGVLPAPPTMMLPTTMTGTGRRFGLASNRLSALSKGIKPGQRQQKPQRRRQPALFEPLSL
jgi:hypothetical protein